MGNKKFRTKLTMIIISTILASVLSVIIAYCLMEIFLRTPLNLLNFNIGNMFKTIFGNQDGIQMFIIILLAFMILILSTAFKLFKLNDYKSKLYEVTPDIKIPYPVKNQTQFGSSWWLTKKQIDNQKELYKNTFDPENPTIHKLMKMSETQRKDEEKLMKEIDEGKPVPKLSTDNLEPKNPNFETKIFKKGGLVVGKKDRTVVNFVKQFPFIKTRKVEDIYYIGDDMHSLTVGATRSGKTRNLVLETIANTGLAGESMILSDPKGELFEYTSGMLRELGYNVVTLDFKNPLKSSKYNFLQPVIDMIDKNDIPKAVSYCSDIVKSLVGEKGNQEAIWYNGEQAVEKCGIMAVVMENSDRVNDQKIWTLFKEKICEDYQKYLNSPEAKKVNEYGEEIEADTIEDFRKRKYEDYKKDYYRLSKEKRKNIKYKYFENAKEKILNYIIENNTNSESLDFLLTAKDFNNELNKDINENYENLQEKFKELNEDNSDEILEIVSNWKNLLDLEPHPELQNLRNVYEFIARMCVEQSDKTMLIDTFLDKLPQDHPAVTQFQSAKIAPSKTRGSFFTSALATLSIFTDPYIADMLAKSDIDVTSFNTQKTALYMILPDEKTTFYGLCSLFVNQCYTKLCEVADAQGGRLNNRVNFILDEFGNFSAINNFGGFLTVGGGRGIRFNLFLQSFSQLNDKYGDKVAPNILDNCHVWTYLKTSNADTAKKISEKLGTYTTSTWSESNSSSGGAVNESKSHNLSKRELLTPDEVLRIQRPYLLTMISGINPCMTYAPDLSKWYFNKVLGLGDPAWNTKIRQIREDERSERSVSQALLWDIDRKMKKEKEKEEENKRREKELNWKRQLINSSFN